MLENVQVSCLRNLRAVRCESLERHNILYGTNGSGKTSFLEALHILGTARSFRAGPNKSLITHGSDGFLVRGEVRTESSRRSALAVQRSLDGALALRAEGQPVTSAAALADSLPLIVLDAQSFLLLTGEPANRRRFLDWGLFHVEHEYRSSRQRFQRALNQRNELLRRGKMTKLELDVWSVDLARQGERVSEGRCQVLEKLKGPFSELISRFAPDLPSIELSYRRGWDSSISYREALDKGSVPDLEQGFTHTGPQRADIRVTVGGYSAAETLSRGQQKLVISALRLAQGRILAERNGGNVLALVDDLPSELDASRAENVCRALADMRVQTVISCVERDAIDLSWLSGPQDCAMFHVEHGGIEQVMVT